MRDTKFIPLWVGLIAGSVALFGNWYNGNQSLKLEEKQFESNLILKSLVPNDSAQSIKNIRFLIEAGFLSSDNEKVIRLIKDTVYNIQLPKNDTLTIVPKDNFEINNSELFAAQVIDEKGKPLAGVNVLTFQKAALKQDSNKAFSKTTTDVNGAFKLAVPNGESVKMELTKFGYVSLRKIYINRMLKSLKSFKLEKAI